jgi:hypothetical protein
MATWPPNRFAYQHNKNDGFARLGSRLGGSLVEKEREREF